MGSLCLEPSKGNKIQEHLQAFVQIPLRADPYGLQCNGIGPTPQGKIGEVDINGVVETIMRFDSKEIDRQLKNGLTLSLYTYIILC